MNDSYFTSSVLSSFIDYLKEGSAFYIIAGVFACIAYGILYNSLAHDKKIIGDKYQYGEILSRVLFGSIFMIVGGLNGFFDFVPGGQKFECEPCSLFMSGLDATGYMFPLVKISEFIIGGLILFNLYTTIAIVMASPIVINIFLYNLFLDQRGIVEASILVASLLYLAWRKQSKFTALFTR
ncbi:MAG: hypothetical protein P8O70_01275 [SAR324 cluster bacterium]|nr:hypothetical protein [SAR324 cluster bacterium]